MLDAVDLFAGPGGWDVAARDLGLEVHGIEWGHWACETRRAAGLSTTEGDVRSYGPSDFPSRGLIASPPCQTFSMAGGGSGRAALDLVLHLADQMDVGIFNPTLSHFDDERTSLVLEPLRWALEGDYEWLAFEQVPTVLPVWEKFAEILRPLGYTVATGKLRAEQYGVPQTRIRAILVACRHKPASLPLPTHRRYRPTIEQDLEDFNLLPWVSMSDALGIDHRILRSNYGSSGAPAARGLRTTEEPAATVTSKINRNVWQLNTGTRPNAAARTTTEPSAALAFGNDAASFAWSPQGTTAQGLVQHKIANPFLRLSTEDAASLQSFPSDYPWRGSKGVVFQQIGNAIPPLLAAAVLRGVMPDAQ